MTRIDQPYQGSWHVSENGASIGLVSGDFATGFVARDQDDSVLGHYPSYERAMYAVLHRRRGDCPSRRRNNACAA